LVCCTWSAARGLLRVVYLHAACCMLRVARCLLSARSCILNIGLHAASRLELHCGTRSQRACVLQGAGVLRRVRCDLADAVRRPPGVTPAQHCNGATVETCGVSDVQPTHACTHAHARTCTYARAHTHALARTCTHAHSPKHTHADARTQKHANARTHV
jgi:hypothetical protein